MAAQEPSSGPGKSSCHAFITTGRGSVTGTLTSLGPGCSTATANGQPGDWRSLRDRVIRAATDPESAWPARSGASR